MLFATFLEDQTITQKVLKVLGKVPSNVFKLRYDHLKGFTNTMTQMAGGGGGMTRSWSAQDFLKMAIPSKAAAIHYHGVIN